MENQNNFKLILDNHDWNDAYFIEARFREIISAQEEYGWKIDLNKMNENIKILEIQLKELYKNIRNSSPKQVINENEIKSPLKKDGTPSQTLLNWYNKLDIRSFSINSVQGPFTRVSIEPINPNSAKQRIETLLKTGWKPTEWNYKKDKLGKIVFIDRKPIKTSPKLTEDSVLNHKLGQLMVQYTQMLHRTSLIKGLKEHLREDNSLPGGANTVGANTGRCLHRVIANIPRVNSFFGKEIRSMFSHRKGYKILGADLSALENKLIGHYTYLFDNGVYARRLIEEDPHQRTIELYKKECGIIINRDVAKTCNYALNFGAGVKKLSNILECKENMARKLHKIWWNDKKPVLQLKKQLEIASEMRFPRFIKGLDGRKVFIRNKKDLVNTLIQSAGSIVNKNITVFIDDMIRESEIDANLVLNYHDEVNYEIKKADINQLKDIINKAIYKVNNKFNFKVPMEMDVQIGNNWAEVH